MEKKTNEIRECFRDTGLELLADDYVYLASLTRKFGNDRSQMYFDRYAIEWLKGMRDQSHAFKKQNSGRFRANSWIRQELLASDDFIY